MFQIITISILSTLVGLLGLKIVMQVTHYLTKRPVTFNKLLAGLRPKLWMTAWLGAFFACFYLSTVYLAAKFLDGDLRQELFNIAYHHPTYFIYAGLAMFASISLGILVVRSVIKRVYNSRR
jgi:hypothetical protein